MKTEKMQSNKAIRGLLIYLFSSTTGSLLMVQFLTLVMAAALMYTGSQLVYTMFSGIGIVGPPYVILMGMGGGKYGKWERFQLSMPLKRSDLVASQYIGILIAAITGLPIVLLFTALAHSMHETLFMGSLTTSLVGVTALLGIPLVMVGLLFPLSCTRWGEDKQEGLAFASFLIAFAVPLLVSIAGNRFGMTEDVSALLSFGLGITVFLVSYMITKRVYSQIDF